MTGQVRQLDNVAVGECIPTERTSYTNVDIFLHLVPFWGTHRIHYDHLWAQDEGFEDVVVPGLLMYTWLERAVVQWAGDPGAIRAFRFRNTGLVLPGQPLQLTGEVTAVDATAKRRIHMSLMIDETSGSDLRNVVTGAAEVELTNAANPGRREDVT
jgi:hydroxyacyl-ACP dehydratase HTD2-like protein with hotdog domain